LLLGATSYYPYYYGYFYGQQTCVDTCEDLVGYFFNKSTGTCDPCQYGCDYCTSSTKCQQCIYGMYLMDYNETEEEDTNLETTSRVGSADIMILPTIDSVCTYYCDSGFYGNRDTGKCEDCPPGCLSCSGMMFRDRAVCTYCEYYAVLDESTGSCNCTFPR